MTERAVGSFPDPADEAMGARARRRYSAPRRWRHRRRRTRRAELPNLVVIGGLKCGTSSMHHYLGLHPEIQMSRPKELNFFVKELNWNLGLDWYASRFDGRYPVRGESSPHYTNLPRYAGVAERLGRTCPEARLIYMVRDPIERMLSHWAHSTGAGYETREIVPTLSDPDTPYMNRSRYWLQLQAFLDHFDRSQIEVIAREDLLDERDRTMRRAFRFLGVDEEFSSPHFEREWEQSSAKRGRKYKGLEAAIRLPGLRWVDGSFELLPEPARWLVERIVHDPGRPSKPKEPLPADLLKTLRSRFAEDVAALREFTGRPFSGWGSYA